MLSTRLYKIVDDAPENDLPLDNRATYLWIWHWLYITQSDEIIKKELDDIQALIDGRHLRIAQILELAWKAEALEKLLDQ